MSMREAIIGFAEQFAWQPEIKNADKLARPDQVVICGMGGSHLAGDILQAERSKNKLFVHSDYGLPTAQAGLPDKSAFKPEETHFILSSYSGNTEEVLSAYQEAKEHKAVMSAIAVGGKLLDIARTDGLPYVQLPATGIQPRSALGYSLLGILKILGDEQMLAECQALSRILQPQSLEQSGAALAAKMRNKIPVIYSSRRNQAVAYNWKIKLNETGKIPAFYNVWPELNHNEMTGFDQPAAGQGGQGRQTQARALSEAFHFIFLHDSADHLQVIKRMLVTKKLYEARGLPVTIVELTGNSRLERIFNSLVLADWTAYHTAEYYGMESEQVPMVEEFKKLII